MNKEVSFSELLSNAIKNFPDKINKTKDFNHSEARDLELNTKIEHTGHNTIEARNAVKRYRETM